MGEYNLCLLDIDYIIEDNKPVIRIFGRTETGKSIVAFDRSFEPYFYAHAKDAEKVAKNIKELESGDFKVEKAVVIKRILEGKDTPIIRVVMHSPREVPSAREKIKNMAGVLAVYEADILFNRRYLFDKGLLPMTMIKFEGDEIEDSKLTGDCKADLFVEIKNKPENTDKPLPKLNIMAFDIEVYNPKGAPRTDVDQITMLSYSSRKVSGVISTKESKTVHEVEKVASELDILKRFEEIVEKEDIDVLVGYNTDQFDLPYMRDRSEVLKYELKFGRTSDKVKFKTKGMFAAAQITGRVHIDLYHYVSYILRGALGSMTKRTLASVSRAFLKEGERKKPLDSKDLWKFWDQGGENLELLFDYSLADAVVTRKLADIFLPKVFEIAKIVKIPVFDAIRTSYGQLVENYLIWNAYEREEIAPNRPVEDEVEARYKIGAIEGAYVHEPTKGLHENVALLDFRSLYPTIIISHNIDPTTIDCDCCKDKAKKVADTEHWFCTKRKGLIPVVLDKIIEKRISVKKKMKSLERSSEEYQKLDNEQYALKILANSAYGYLAYRNARWYSRDGASSVTALGRMYIKKIMDIAEKSGLEVIYGDTDSLFAKTKEGKIEDKIDGFLKKVNPELPGVMELELDGIYTRGIFVSKKRYALIDKERRIIIKGLEFVRKDWSPLAKQTQKDVIEALLKEGSAETAFEIVKKAIKKIKDGKVTKEDLAVYTELTRPLKDYKVTAPHIAVAKKLKDKGEEIKTGTSIGYIIVKDGGKLISERARPVDEVKFENYDKEYYIGHQIIPAVSRVMEALGYEEGDLLGKKQFKLTKFT